MSKQSRKQSLNLAGEFFVAAELQRRGIMAAVTYGNAKQADVVAINPESSQAVVIEVKSTSENEWVLGSSIPIANGNPWVLVYILRQSSEPPQYFVICGSDLHQTVSKRHDIYRSDYFKRNGKDFTGSGVYKIKRKEVETCKDAWSVIEKRVGS